VRQLCISAMWVLLTSATASAQVDLTGSWQAVFHEDQPERIPGPALGDYLGLPINDSARAFAEAWALLLAAAAVVVEAVEEVVVAVVAVVPASVDKLARRKAERRLKPQRESLYPRSVGDHYCG